MKVRTCTTTNKVRTWTTTNMDKKLRDELNTLALFFKTSPNNFIYDLLRKLDLVIDNGSKDHIGVLNEEIIDKYHQFRVLYNEK